MTDEQKRLATPLVEKYIERFTSDKDKFEVLAVENPWFVWLDLNTLIVGVMDANRYDMEHKRYEDVELKTRRAPRFKNNGEPYKGDTEQDWMSELSSSPQVGIYALARMKASFLSPLPNVSIPYIRVRAAVKSDGKVGKPSPIMIWPTADDGLFTFPDSYLKQSENGLLNAARGIRTLREYASLPWQLRGAWCSRFGRDCEMLAPVCSKGNNSQFIEPITDLSRTDPGARAIEAGMAEFEGDRGKLVILSAGAYNDFGHCAELWRLRSGGWFPAQESDALGIGTAFHSGCAEFGRTMIKEKQ